MAKELGLLSIDAINAFSSMCHNQLYQLIIEDIQDLLQWFLFLYDGPIDVQFDATHILQILGGLIQGLTSSMYLYGAGKWKIQSKTNQLMIQKYPEFTIDYQVDYVDDGGQLMNLKYIRDYIDIIAKIYSQW